MILTVISLVLLGLLFYAWVVYPLLLALFSRRPISAAESHQADAPSVRIAVLVAAHNEENHIERRLRNLTETLGVAQAAGLIDGYQILVGSDGSTDETVQRARAAAEGDDRISIHAFERQRGKMAVLKELVEEVDCGRWAVDVEEGEVDPASSDYAAARCGPWTVGRGLRSVVGGLWTAGCGR